jgi:hypothetical protein
LEVMHGRRNISQSIDLTTKSQQHTQTTVCLTAGETGGAT